MNEETTLGIIGKELDRADSADYEAVFSTPQGKRVLGDLCLRYQVGGPSFLFDAKGRVDIAQSARNDAAKVIIADIVRRANFKAEKAEKPTRAKREVESLPSAATNI